MLEFSAGLKMDLGNTAGSWRGIQLSDPPAPSAHVTLGVSVGRLRNYGHTAWTVPKKDGKGITLGDVIDAGNETKHDTTMVSKATGKGASWS